MSARWLVIIEGVDFAHTVLDTDDLATIRGGSWALLESLQMLPAILAAVTRGDLELEVISIGASKGAFRAKSNVTFDGPDDVERTILNKLREPLAASGRSALGLGTIIDVLPHLSFTCGAAAFTDDSEFSSAYKSASRKLALNQYRRSIFNQPSRQGGAALLPPVCSIDGFRPADEETWQTVIDKNGERTALRNLPVSSSVFHRKRFGRTGRRSEFYAHYAQPQVSAALPAWGYADNFEEIASEGDCPEDYSANVKGKMAVIYMDGIAFGKLQNRLGGVTNEVTPKTIGSISETISGHRRRLLASIHDFVTCDESLHLKVPQKAFLDTNDDSGKKEKRTTPVLKFETLLWGADESLHVFPAYALEGLLRQLNRFLQEEQNAEATNKPALPYAYGIGIVVCGYKTPIRLVNDLAKSLSANASQYAKKKAIRTQAPVSHFDIMVLSGNDVPLRDIGRERQALFANQAVDIDKKASFLIPLEHAAQVFEACRDIKGVSGEKELGLPRSELIKLLWKSKEPDPSSPYSNANYLVANREFNSLFEAGSYKRLNGEKFSSGFLKQPCFEWAEHDPLSILRFLLPAWDFIKSGVAVKQ